MNKERYREEDEIDLRELLFTIWKRKIFIISFTFFVTLISIIYISTKEHTPVYSGSLLIEIGEIKTQNPNQIYFDNPNNLKNIIERKFTAVIEIPKRSNNLILVKINDIKKENIKNKINIIYNFILARHKEKTKIYTNYIMTKKIADINIENEAINNPKKKLIITVSFITGLILSIFIIFFIEFITKKDEEKEL